EVAEGLQISITSVQRGLRAAERAGLLSIDREPGCKLAVSALDLPGSKPELKHRPLYGPVPWPWWFPGFKLPGKALQVAVVCWLLAGWERSAEFELKVDDWAEFGLPRFSAYRGLQALEGAGLVSVVRRSGQSPVVEILEPAP